MRELELGSMEKVRLQGDLPVPKGAYKKSGEGFLTMAWSDRARGDGFKLKEGQFS